MSPRQAAIDHYKRFPHRDLFQDVSWHLQQSGAVVIWTQRLVLMARPVCLDTNPEQIIDPEWDTKDPKDAWFVHYMAGDFSALAEHREEMLQFPWIAFQRRNREKIHVLRTENFLKHAFNNYEKITIIKTIVNY